MAVHRIEKDSMGPIEVPADKLWGLRPNVHWSIFGFQQKKCRWH